MDKLQCFRLPLSQKRRRILHIDADAFFASVEQLLNPQLKGKPIAVGGPNDGKGIVSAASYEARVYGVKSAMPLFKAKKLCPDLVVVPGNFAAYREYSNKMSMVMHKYTHKVQRASIDEAYLDISDCEENVEMKILAEIYETIRLSISCGMASSRMVAKVASSTFKPHKLTRIAYGKEAKFLAPLDLRAIPGIGPSSGGFLAKYGFFKVGDLQRLELDEVLSKLGLKGVALWKRAKGIDNSTVKWEGSLPKSISKERTFYRPLSNLCDIEKALAELAKRVVVKMKKWDMEARTGFIKVRYLANQQTDEIIGDRKGWKEKFSDDGHQFPVHFDAGKFLLPEAYKIYQTKHSKEQPVRLLGVGVSGLNHNYNLRLFDI